MISDSDSGSDSDDCLVYKTVRPVVWSDEEEEKPKENAGAGSRRAREDDDDSDEVVCATSASARKRARTARAATTSNADVEVVEIDDEKRPSAADAFLVPPPAKTASGVVQSVDVATLESVYASRRRMAELRAAAAAPMEAPEPVAPPPSVQAGAAGGGASASGAAVGGKTIAIVFQTPRGARCEWSCSDARTFSEILGDFFASEDGAGVRRELEDPPALLFDGEAVDQDGTTPRELDMEDGDVVDLK